MSHEEEKKVFKGVAIRCILKRFLRHIQEEFQEEFEDLFTEEDLKAMDHDELAFTWLRYSSKHRNPGFSFKCIEGLSKVKTMQLTSKDGLRLILHRTLRVLNVAKNIQNGEMK